jgi:hypothetical protein
MIPVVPFTRSIQMEKIAMRLTRELLINAARSATSDLLLRDDDVVCVYLTGSVLGEQPLIGGTTDVDLICVHSIKAPVQRELQVLGEDYHLDIAHFTQGQFGQNKTLRLNPWLGSFLCYNPIMLYDTQHWFEFTQAGVFAHFLEPSYVIQRVRPFIQQARQKWLELDQVHAEPNVDYLWKYIKALEYAGNSLACLVGVPLTERRFIQGLPARTEALERPGLSSGLVDLFCPPEDIELNWSAWLEDWRNIILAANEIKHFPIGINSLRIPYYEKSILSLIQEYRSSALWILLRTWTLALTHLPKRTPEATPWHQFVQTLNLGKEQFPARLKELDTYLEAVEETIDVWAKQNGVN